MSDNSKNPDNRIEENERGDSQKSAPKVFQFIDGNTLMKRRYEPLKFAVEKILPRGIFIIAGAGKSAKSFWCLDLCVSIATGNKMWKFSCEHGDALYLALEDNYLRLQDRLNKIKAGELDISRLKLVTSSFGINSGLIEQTYNHLAKYPDTRIIVCDTLEKIRDTVYDDNIYAIDIGNSMLDANFYHNIERAKSMNIPVSLDAYVPNDISVSAVDLNIIIGNTFDNALEECAEITETKPKIKVSLVQKNDMLFYEIVNPCALEPHKKPGSIHGYGLQNVRRCVEKYNGSMSNGIVDGQYRVSIRLGFTPT